MDGTSKQKTGQSNSKGKREIEEEENGGVGGRGRGRGRGRGEADTEENESGKGSEKGRGRKTEKDDTFAATSTTETVERYASGRKKPTKKTFEIPIDLRDPDPVSEEKKSEPKRKKVSPKMNVANPDPVLTDNISKVLEFGSNLLASRAGEHWNISKSEADGIAEPLTKVIQRLGFLEMVSEYSDYGALIIAVGMVVTPRIIESMKPKTQKSKESVRHEQKRENVIVSRPNDTGNEKPDTTNVSNGFTYVSEFDPLEPI